MALPRWVGLAILTLLAAAAMAIGAIPPAATLLFGLGSACLLGTSLALRQRSLPLPLASVVFAALGLWCLVQSVPLPASLLALLSPRSASIWAGALATAGDAPGAWASISLAPEQSRLEAVKWLSYSALCWLGAWWSRYRGLNLLCWGILALSLLLGVVTAIHGLLDAQTIFGLYTPQHSYARWTRGPLLNVNHLSAYLSLGVYASVALLVSDKNEEDPRRIPITVTLLLVAIALVAAIIGVASRAAVFALAAGGLMTPLLLFRGAAGKRRRQREESLRSLILTIVGIFGAGTALALYGFGDGIAAGLGEKNFSKLTVARESLPMIRDYWLTGVGRGAFEGVFFQYQGPGHSGVWAHPENILVQWTSEWGVVVSAIAAITLLVTFSRSRGWSASRAGRILALGLLMNTAHNLLDYNSEVTAIGGLLALITGAVLGQRIRDASEEPSSSPLRRLVPLGVAALTASIALLSLLSPPQHLQTLRLEARKLLRKNAADPASSIDLLRAWLRRFPADPYVAMAAGAALTQSQPRLSLRWYNWALLRAPNLGAARLGLSEALARAGFRSQALIELRIGLERDPDVAAQAIPLATALVRSADELLRITPAGPKGLGFLEAVAQNLKNNSEIYPQLRQRILQQHPCATSTIESSLQQRIASLEARQPPCQGDAGVDACRSEIEEALVRLRQCPGNEGPTARLRSDLLWALGQRKEAMLSLEESCDTANDLSACLERVAQRAAELKDQERLRRTLRIVVSRRCQDPAACGQAWGWAARLHETAGDLPSAFVAITKATESDPNDMALRHQQILTALAVGAASRAETLLLQLIARRPDDAWARAKLDELRNAPRPAASSPGAPPMLPPKLRPNPLPKTENSCAELLAFIALMASSNALKPRPWPAPCATEAPTPGASGSRAPPDSPTPA